MKTHAANLAHKKRTDAPDAYDAHDAFFLYEAIKISRALEEQVRQVCQCVIGMSDGCASAWPILPRLSHFFIGPWRNPSSRLCSIRD
jgi:hypothetical protein